jgi:osmotically-inducible protein OsmY
MNGLFRMLTVAVVLTGTLPACAVYSKCGFTGCAEDAKIAADVRTLIRQHPALEAPNYVRVQSMNHVVYLYGQVDTDLERSMAESIAGAVPDVRRVVDSINLSYEGR